jgi:phosphate transport system protein
MREMQMERHFDLELAVMKKDVLLMGSMAEEAIARSLDSLRNRSPGTARTVIESDRIVDALELKIDEECLSLLALRQPMAYDLRFITMAMKITTDLERVADLAVDIAQRVLELADKPLLKPLVDIPKLGILAQQMMKDALASFVYEDTKLARSVILRDPEADSLRNLVQSELVEKYISKDPATAARAIPLMLIARHLERICDHATNISEDVIYMVKAKVVKHHIEKLNNGL